MRLRQTLPLVALGLFAACPAAPTQTAKPARPAAKQPAGAAVQVQVRQNPEDKGDLSLDNVPVISADGQRVLIDASLADGAGARPNLAFSIVAVDSGQTQHQTVLTPDEYDMVNDGEALRPTLQARLSRAAEHLRGDWRSLVQLRDEGDKPILSDPSHAHALVSAGAKLRVAFDEPVLTVALDGKQVYKQAHPQWTKKNPEPQCEHPAFISQGWYDAGTQTLVFTISYFGPGVCGDPEPLTIVKRIAPKS